MEQSSSKRLSDASRHSTLGAASFGMHSGSKRDAAAMDLTEASHSSGRLSLPESNSSGIKSVQKSDAHVRSRSAAQQQQQQQTAPLSVDKAVQPFDFTQEAVPGKTEGAKQDSQHAVLTDSSRKKRRSFLLQSKTSQKVLDLT